MKTFNTLALIGALAFIVTTSSGCNGGGGSHHYDPYVPMWYDVYGHACGNTTPMPGCNYYSNGVKIIDTEDPYFNSSYFLEYAFWTYTDTFGYGRSYTGWAWLSPDGILYDDWGRALNQNGEDSDRDLIASAAAIEQSNVENAGRDFAARYSLANEEDGMKVARALNQYNKIGKDRARTAEDYADFSGRLFGVPLNKITDSLAKAKTGDRQALEGTISEISNHWGTTPETSKEILKNAYKDFLSDYNL